MIWRWVSPVAMRPIAIMLASPRAAIRDHPQDRWGGTKNPAPHNEDLCSRQIPLINVRFPAVEYVVRLHNGLADYQLRPLLPVRHRIRQLDLLDIGERIKIADRRTVVIR